MDPCLVTHEHMPQPQTNLRFQTKATTVVYYLSPTRATALKKGGPNKVRPTEPDREDADQDGEANQTIEEIPDVDQDLI